MASQQQLRRDESKEPKVTSRFESLTVKESSAGDQQQPTAVVHQVTETIQLGSTQPDKYSTHQTKKYSDAQQTAPGGLHHNMQREQQQQQQREQQHQQQMQREQQQQQQMQRDDLEEISKYRGMAQQNSMEAIQAAQERYQRQSRANVEQRGTATGPPEYYYTSQYSSSDQMERTPELADMAKKGASYVGDVTMQTGTEFATGVTDTVQQIAGQAAEAGLTAGEYVGKAAGVLKDVAVVAGWNAAKLVGDTAAGAMETVGDVSGQVIAPAIDTTVDTTARGTRYVGEAGIGTAKTTAEYARAGAGALKDVAVGAAGVIKDAAVVGGWNTAEFASNRAADLQDVYGQSEQMTAGAIDKTVDLGEKGAGYVGETAREAGMTAAEYARRGAGVVKDVSTKSLDTTMDVSRQGGRLVGDTARVLKDAAVVAGWETAEFAGDKGADAIKTMEDVSRQAVDSTGKIIDKTVDMSAKGVRYAGETAVAGKDVAVGTGKTAAEFARQGAGVLKDVAAESVDRTLGMSEQGARFVADTAGVGIDAIKTGAEYAGKAAGKAAGVVKDAAVVGGWTTAKTAADVVETMGDVSGQAVDATGKIIDRTVDMSAKGARYAGETGKDVAVGTGKTAAEYARQGAGVLRDVAAESVDRTLDMTEQGGRFVGDTATVGRDALKTGAEYAGKAAGVVKDAAVVGGWNTAKTAVDAVDTMEDVAGQAVDATGKIIDRTVDMGAKRASYAGETAVGTGKTAAEYARKGAGVLKDVAAESAETTLGMTERGGRFVGDTTAVGRDAIKTGAQYAGKAAGAVKDAAVVGGWNTAKTAVDAVDTMEDVAGQAVDATGKIIDRTVDMGTKGARYAGETAVAGKDVAVGTGKTAAEYARKGAGVLRDVASETADTTLNMTEQGGRFVGDTASLGRDAIKTSAEYAGKGAGVLKDAAVVGGWNTAEFASKRAADLRDVSSQAVDATGKIIDRTVDMGEKGADYIGQAAVAGKDLTMETGKTAAQYAQKGAGAMKDVSTGLIDTTLDMGQKGASYVGEAARDYDARNKAEKERQFKMGGELGGQRGETRRSGGVGLDIKNQTTKGAKDQQNQPGDIIIEGRFKQKGPGGVKEEGKFKVQESGGVVQGSVEHRGTGDAGGAMRMIGKTLADAGDNKKDSKKK